MKSQSSLPQSVGATHEFVSWVLEPNTEPGKWICQLGIEVLVLWYILSWIHSIHQIHSKCIEIDTLKHPKAVKVESTRIVTLNTGSPNLTLYNLRCSQRVRVIPSHTVLKCFEAGSSSSSSVNLCPYESTIVWSSIVASIVLGAKRSSNQSKVPGLIRSDQMLSARSCREI